MQINTNFIPKTPKTYLVGGTVRDMILGLTPKDYDLVTLEDPRQTAARIAESIKGRVIELGKPGKSVFRIITRGLSLDITPASGASIEEDLGKRDFTVNGMAASLSSGRFIDLFDGVRDLKNKTIRMISPDNLRADPIRLLRAYRLAACLNFSIDRKTCQSIAAESSLISTTAGERVRDELLKLLASSDSHHFVSMMNNTGLLAAIFPELSALKECSQNTYHQYNAFEHTMQAVYYLEKLLHSPESLISSNHFLKDLQPEENCWPLLKYSVLLHDIGKPQKRSVGKDGRAHFYNHESAGAEMTKKINRRLRLSKRQNAYVDFIIRHHLKPLALFTAFQKNRLSQKAISRFFLKCNNLSIDLFTHAIADICGKGITDNASAFIEFADQIGKAYTTSFFPLTNRPQLLNGDDLIREFGLSPSPLFSKILRHVEEERISQTISTRDEALASVKKFINLHNPS
ncbi:MAG: CCA tRNA nucleotidyltransferase [Desulfobacteraceae bacterium]|nr:MAG: CCA tRNA nucleotidyltransferase [Desulfobacteraceae bacterium]